MQRTTSMIRRRPNLVDLVFPRDSTAANYRLKWSSNFDAPMTTFLTVPMGFRDPSLDLMKVEARSVGDRIRVVFNPTTYSIPDTAPFWIQLWHVPAAGPEVQKSASTLVLTDQARHGYQTIVIHGQVPNAASLATALQLDLPGLMSDVRVHNEDGATNMFLALEETGVEFLLKPDTQPQWTTFESTISSVWLRGSGAAANMMLTGKLAQPR